MTPHDMELDATSVLVEHASFIRKGPPPSPPFPILVLRQIYTTFAQKHVLAEVVVPDLYR
jgi:hypothetical protein